MKVAVLIQPPVEGERLDQSDTLDQAREVVEALERLGHDAAIVHYVDHGTGTERNLSDAAPDIIFNLVEDVPEGPHEVFRATATLDRLGLRYTGARTETLAVLGDKRAMKAHLAAAGLPVVPAFEDAPADGSFIVKHAFEHGSVGLEGATNVVRGADAARRLIDERIAQFGGEWFAEPYVDGREFDVSVYGTPDRCRVLPAAEVTFDNHDGRPTVFGYASKWEIDPFDAMWIMRVFPPPDSIVEAVTALTEKTWRALRLTGFAHIDFRVDRQGRPYILEVNVNPCILRCAGFCEAAEQLGMTHVDVVAAILEAA